MTRVTPKSTRSQLRLGVAYAGLWVVMVLFYWGVLIVQTSGYMPIGEALLGSLRLSSVPAVLGLGIWWCTGRLRWPEQRLSPFIAAHVGMAIVFGGITAWWGLLPLLKGARPELDVPLILRSILPWQFVSGMFMYGLMAGVSYAIRGSWGARDLRLATERAERLRAQAELAALRAHINPHFLFNTLHSVTQLLRTDPARAEAALERLSELFRYALRLDRERVELVSLEEEWKFTSSYLWLEQMRMGDRLKVDADLSEDSLACAVPPFTLQPLVENAVRHGLGPKKEGGTLTIRSGAELDRVSIVVADNGVGASADALANGAGLGLRSVRQRLEARYGSQAHVLAAPGPSGGLRVAVQFPIEAAP